jgi:hypothetical protein
LIHSLGAGGELVMKGTTAARVSDGGTLVCLSACPRWNAL